MIFHDVLVIGGGLAGLRAAISAAEKGVDVGIVTKLYPPRSHSGQAQGGINAALANNPKAADDNPEKHVSIPSKEATIWPIKRHPFS
jgi:succinate dehydrogenase / fumarate reductase flavoprotein subunit